METVQPPPNTTRQFLHRMLKPIPLPLSKVDQNCLSLLNTPQSCYNIDCWNVEKEDTEKHLFGDYSMDKYAELNKCGTNGANYGLGPEDILAKFQEWDKLCDFSLSEIDFDRVTVNFRTLPEDLDSFAKDVYDFCPDTVDQGFGCVEGMIGAAEEMGEDIPEDMKELVEGVNFEDEDYGIELLKRSLKRDMKVCLWWD